MTKPCLQTLGLGLWNYGTSDARHERTQSVADFWDFHFNKAFMEIGREGNRLWVYGLTYINHNFGISIELLHFKKTVGIQLWTMYLI